MVTRSYILLCMSSRQITDNYMSVFKGLPGDPIAWILSYRTFCCESVLSLWDVLSTVEEFPVTESFFCAIISVKCMPADSANLSRNLA